VPSRAGNGPAEVVGLTLGLLSEDRAGARHISCQALVGGVSLTGGTVRESV